MVTHTHAIYLPIYFTNNVTIIIPGNVLSTLCWKRLYMYQMTFILSETWDGKETHLF